MRIAEVKLLRLETPQSGGPAHQQQFLQVHTDEGITSRVVSVNTPEEVERMRGVVVGEDPLEREKLFQILNGTRHVRKAWEGPLDNCLWDIAGQAAGLPVHALIGRVRDRIPAYLTDRLRRRANHDRPAPRVRVRRHHAHGGQQPLPLPERTGNRRAGPGGGRAHGPAGPGSGRRLLLRPRRPGRARCDRGHPRPGPERGGRQGRPGRPVRADDLATAIDIHRTIEEPLEQHLRTYPGGRDAALHGLFELRDISGRWRRAPYHSLTDDELERLEAFADQLGVL